MHEKERQQEKIKIVVDAIGEQPADTLAPAENALPVATPSVSVKSARSVIASGRLLQYLPPLIALGVIWSIVVPRLSMQGSQLTARLNSFELCVCYICATIFVWLGPGKLAMQLSKNPVMKGAFHGAFIGGVVLLLMLYAGSGFNLPYETDTPIARLISYLCVIPIVVALIAFGPGGLVGALIGARKLRNQTELPKVKLLGCQLHSDELPAELQQKRKAKLSGFSNIALALTLTVCCAALLIGPNDAGTSFPLDNTFITAVLAFFNDVANHLANFLSSMHI